MKKGPMAFRMIVALKRKIGKIEMKFTQNLIIGAQIGFLIPGPVIVDQFVLISEETGPQDRIGSRISVQNINFKGRVHMPAAVLQPITYRAILVYFPNNVGISSPLNGILDNTTSGAAAVISLYKKKVSTNTEAFRIILDKTWSIATVDAGNSRPLNFFHRFKKPLAISYVGTLPTVANVNKNLIKLFIFSDGAGVGSVPLLDYTWRMNYSDN